MVEHFRNTIRLRWRFGGLRYSITVGPDSQETLSEAQRLSKEIALDIKRGRFDVTLSRYKNTSKYAEGVKETSQSRVRDLYKIWLTIFGETAPMNVITTGKMVNKWGSIDLSQMPEKMSAEKLAPVTFNIRLNILRRFCKWLKKKEYTTKDLLSEIENRRGNKTRPQRRPFDAEIIQVLEAFKNNTFSKSNTWPHNHYYPFLCFMVHTGVRNAEAIGLQVGRVNFKKSVITIDQAFARTLKGDNAKARVLKGTKTNNIRHLPLTGQLAELLVPLCEGRKPDEFVFTSHIGNPVNDRMFQQKFLKPVLKKLDIEERDLYALRHTFGTMAIEQGFTPLEAGYLMGHNNPRTILDKYAHLRKKPTRLPKIP
jgi:integrase